MCPKGAEATVFALLTALGNFGSSISSYFGAFVLQYFDIRTGHFDNLVLVILIKSCSRVLPILLIPFLVPRGSPYSDDEEAETDATGSSANSSFDNRSTSRSRRKKVHKSQAYENIQDTSEHSNSSAGGSLNGHVARRILDDEDHEIMLMPSWKDTTSPGNGGETTTHNPLRKVDRIKLSTI